MSPAGTVRRRDFSGPDDLRAMQDLCSRVWSPTSRFHPGQLAWSRYHRPVDPAVLDASEAIALWTAGDRTVAFGWAEAPDWLELQVDPDHPGLAVDVLEWFEEWSDADEQSAMAVEGDAAVETALADAGFEPRPDDPFFTHHVLDLDALPAARDVPGYTCRAVRPDEATERAAVHAAAWSDLGPSRVDATAYRQLGRAWPYRSDLDHVAVDAEGEMVASALVWLDPATGAGLVEPVGCVPGHRGRGLAGAVTLSALHALRAAGGVLAQVTPRGDDAYPGPQRLYRSIGFRPSARVVTWTRASD
ncbi:GNAT family N-acetyltransferase [Terrabacter sp. NPDC000476]|uniref:GNAT family N-acetyltransferase n=1 Tax=Terrabacter sp. NPDC000476 TaxID=3154258 RepID=UPI00332DB90D